MDDSVLAIALSLVLAASSSGCGAARPPAYDYQSERSSPAAYRVGPGDVLKVNVWKNEQLTQQVAVRPDGAITLPLIGDVPVAGRSVDEIATSIAQLATRFFTEPQNVTVQVAEIKSYRVYVLGEVLRPGEYAPATQINVLQALSLGGGFTRFARPDDILVVRKDARGMRRIPFAYSLVVGGGDLRENITLQSGDTVVVP